jgi:hypothetical protein
MIPEMSVREPVEARRERRLGRLMGYLLVLVAGIALGYWWHAYHAARAVTQ